MISVDDVKGLFHRKDFNPAKFPPKFDTLFCEAYRRCVSTVEVGLADEILIGIGILKSGVITFDSNKHFCEDTSGNVFQDALLITKDALQGEGPMATMEGEEVLVVNLNFGSYISRGQYMWVFPAGEAERAGSQN